MPDFDSNQYEMKNKKYTPIDCNFHDILLDRATRQSAVVLEYVDSDGIQCKEAVIKDVYTKEGEEFLLTHSGETIRLDQIVSLDGKEPTKVSAC